MPSTVSTSPSGNQDVDGLLYNQKWAVSNFTFSFPASSSFYQSGSAPNGETVSNFGVLNATQQNYVRNYVLPQYASVANVTFSEITETAGTHADLRYAKTDATSTAWAYMPASQAYGGDSWYRNSGGTYDNPVVGNYAAHTFLHETGHAMGLLHGHDASNPYGALPASHDSVEYSVMTYRSYVGGPTSGYTYGSSSAPQALMQDDIAALQYLYGANFNTRAGNTVYTWSPTTGQQFIDGVGQSTPTGNKIFMTVWDGGGVDTYDFSNYTTNLTIDLRPGAWTTVSSTQVTSLGSGHSAAGNIANALLYNNDTRSLIETAIGGSGNDTIIGNAGNNTFNGRQGNDVLTGGVGDDTFVFASGWGGDTVTDFVAGSSSGDKIDLSAMTAITTLSQALSYATQSSANTIFNFSASDILTLVNVTLGNLITGDFIFAGPPPPPPSPYPYAEIEGDFDGDSQADILWRNDGGAVSMWKMNGAQYLVSWIGNDWQIAGTGDFNGDSKSDVLWRNSTGAVKLWQMNGEQIQLEASVGSRSTDWHILGVGDFNGDNKSDVLWQNDNGAVSLWQMNGTQIQLDASVGSPATEGNIVGIGDFNGDNKSDILWRDNAGATNLWQMNGSQIQANTSLGPRSNDWHLIGIGDFDGDGVSDILWRNDSGAPLISTMNGTSTLLTYVPDDWDVAGIGDFNIDGKDDVLWRHNTGAVTMWQMNGTPVSINALVGAASSDWHIVATGDFKGDAIADVLWRNDDGAFSVWEMDGSQTLVGWLSNSWQIAGVGNLKGDAKADIVWQNSSGAVAVWEANGTQYSLGSNTSDWHVAGIGDFRGDSKSDILWQNDNGALSLWETNGAQTSFGSNTSDWHILGTGNLSGDGMSDILWRNDSGALSVWVTNASQISLGSISSDWHFAAFGDFNGDSINDILWRNDSGAITWLETSGTGHAALWVPNFWHIAGSGDYNGDGATDILWRHDNGAVTMTGINGTQTLVGNSSNDWHLVSENSNGTQNAAGSAASSEPYQNSEFVWADSLEGAKRDGEYFSDYDEHATPEEFHQWVEADDNFSTAVLPSLLIHPHGPDFLA